MNIESIINQRQPGALAWFREVNSLLDRGGAVSFTPKGLSMWPTLRPDSDVVTLARAPRYRRGDMLLALSHSPAGVFLHRVVAVDHDGNGYTLMGDANTTQREHVAAADVAGRVVSVERGGRQLRPSLPGALPYLMPRLLRRIYIAIRK